MVVKFMLFTVRLSEWCSFGLDDFPIPNDVVLPPKGYSGCFFPTAIFHCKHCEICSQLCEVYRTTDL